MLIFIKKTIIASAILALILLTFSACLKQENIELATNPLEVLNDTKLTFFKLDSVVMVPLGGYSDVYLYYSNSYNTFSAETQKRIGGVAITHELKETIGRIDQNTFVVRAEPIGAVLDISFAFILNKEQERSRSTGFQIIVK